MDKILQPHVAGVYNRPLLGSGGGAGEKPWPSLYPFEQHPPPRGEWRAEGLTSGELLRKLVNGFAKTSHL